MPFSSGWDHGFKISAGVVSKCILRAALGRPSEGSPDTASLRHWSLEARSKLVSDCIVFALSGELVYLLVLLLQNFCLLKSSIQYWPQRLTLAIVANLLGLP